jgi:DNA-binding LacI/PurR family transcriptional regulator
VPADVSVVGFDDSALMTCTDPPLTTVRQPIETMGQAAVDLLVNQIEGAAATTDELLFEPELVVRGSTGRVPAQGS